MTSKDRADPGGPTVDAPDEAYDEVDWSYRNLDEVAQAFIVEFKARTPLHFFSIMPYREDNEFQVFIFFNTNSDVVECKASGISRKMLNYVFEKLEEFGRGPRSEVSLFCVIDSFENVQRDYGGDYYVRLYNPELTPYAELQQPG